MSKSLGNFTNLLDLIERHDPRAYRMLVLRSHYRSPVEVTAATIADAERSLDRLDAFARRRPPADARRRGVGGPGRGRHDGAQFRTAMDDDLNTPGAVDQLFRAVRAANTALDAEDDATAGAAGRRPCGRCAGRWAWSCARGARRALRRRCWSWPSSGSAAGSAKDFAAADRIRAQLSAQGWLVEDSAQGAVLRRKSVTVRGPHAAPWPPAPDGRATAGAGGVAARPAGSVDPCVQPGSPCPEGSAACG